MPSRQPGASALLLAAALLGACALGASARSAREKLEEKCEWLDSIRGTNREAWLRSQGWFHGLERKCDNLAEEEDRRGLDEDEEEEDEDEDAPMHHGHGMPPPHPGHMMAYGEEQGWQRRCMMVLQAQNSGHLEWIRQQPWYEAVLAHCPALAHGARAAGAPAEAPVAAIPAGLDPAALEAWEPELLDTGCKWLAEEATKSGQLVWLQQQPWYESLARGCEKAKQQASAPGSAAPSHSWSTIMKGMVQNKKCDWLRMAKESNQAHEMGVASMDWFKDMEAKCEGAAGVPAPPTTAARAAGGGAASSWHQLANAVRQRFSSPAQAEAVHPQAVRMDSALARKCMWLQSSAGQSPMIQRQAWYPALKQKCAGAGAGMPSNVFV